MEAIEWIRWGLYHVKEMFPLEVALTLGMRFFALSWVRPRPIVSLPRSGRRASMLLWLGVAGAATVLAVATATSWLSYLHAFPDDSGFDGWWRRPTPLLTAAVVVLVAVPSLRAEPLPAPREGVVSPRRRWWAFASKPLLWSTAAAAFLLFTTSSWQTLIGVSAPHDANLYGSVPESTDLPVYMSMQGGMGYVSGAGWPNHIATLVALAVAVASLVLALGGDANRSLFARAAAADIREERVATARFLVFLVLGGLLLALGAVWAHIGFIGEITVGVHEAGASEDEIIYVGTGYQDVARLTHKGGYVVQGIGAALLLRLTVDTLRAKSALRRLRRADGPDPNTALASPGHAESGTGR